MEILNYTPHDINMYRDGVKEFTYESIGIARCTVSDKITGYCAQYPVYRAVLGEVENLPQPKKNTWYIVSRVIAEKLKGTRNDLLIPYKTVRNDKGQIIGCEGFAVL